MSGNELILLFLGILFLLLFIGVPIAFTLLLVAVALLIAIGNFDPQLIAQSVIFGANSYTLLAIPFFILAGEIMSYGGISRRIVDFVASLFGHVRGGLGYVVIIASTIFAGLSGSAVADAAALGAILIPMMVQMGYDKATSVALVCASAIIAPIIPPSIPMILFGVAGQVSISRLFMSGIVPGLILALSLMTIWYFIARKNNYPVGQKASPEQVLKAFKGAIFALVMPLIIVGGIRFGIFTPTEAGAIAVVYAFIISVLVYKEINLKEIPQVLTAAARTTGQVLLVAATAMSAAWVITTASLPQKIVTTLSGLAEAKLMLLLVINVFLLFLGMVMDITPAILIFTPILIPLIKQAGIDPIYFGLIMTLNLVIGLITPPVGTVLYVGCGVGKINMAELVRKILPFIMVEFIVLLLLILFPRLVIAPLGWLVK
ncbi:TRAP transporter large permease [Desulfofundulus thermosubterraneus]|uniref:TRAP transporter, DctM subunit n=1 Tax=Desulfofundulus thermosubterraneus DSM 16057 TaxID=1121432 RepID=A0A1M6M4S2_9FIRM|nr:TRAP transporter large permease [Desulfofundulus thermosubterraneus]SHJ78441.1 TRAP transporter, DctM subunit [Desulfofundulus thermosubterraneus DSM 16057]